MSSGKVKAYPALFALLAFGIFLNIFPILSVIPVTETEQNLLAVIRGMHTSGISGIWETINGGDIVENSYALISMRLMDLAGQPDSIFWLRFPTAIITAILTLCLFRFDRTSETLGNSFIAALVFMGCAYVEMMCIMTQPVMISAVFVILSLVSLYHWMRLPNMRNTVLMVAAMAASTIVTGALSLILILVLGTVCLLFTGKKARIFYLVLSVASTVAVLAILFYLLTGDVTVLESLFLNITGLDEIENDYHSTSIIFFSYLFLTVFPWSILMLFSIPWGVRHIKTVYDNILKLSRMQRFGIYVFLVSLPLFFIYSHYSNVLVLASAFFNAPTVGRILIWQFNQNPNAWRITGGICSVIFGIVTVLFILLNNGISVMGISFGQTYWSLWNIILVVAIFISIYSITRNWREVYRNHRFFFNLIILYLLMQNLTAGYIIPNIVF